MLKQKTLPFDLEAFKRGEKAVTVSGQPVEFVAHVPTAMPTHRLLVKVGSMVRHYKEDGTRADEGMHLKLVPKTITRAVWVRAVYRKLPGDATPRTVEVQTHVIPEGEKPHFARLLSASVTYGPEVLLDTFEGPRV